MKTFLVRLEADRDFHDEELGPLLPDVHVHVLEEGIHVEDDMGSRTEIKTIYSETMLGIRRAVRQMNVGRIPIYSEYDCTGKCCFQGCKLLKVYKTYSEGYVAVVELRRSYDV